MPTYSYSKLPPLQKILAQIEIQPNGCWYWLAGRSSGGYGTIVFGPRSYKVHRVMYEIFNGPIPDGMDLDHQCHKPDQCPGGNLCLHRRCVNPDHVVPATNAENSSRERSRAGLATGAKNKAKTHCPKGHPYDEKNTGLRKRGRYCRRCTLDAGIAWRKSKRDKQ